jgi:hypothetical protein
MISVGRTVNKLDTRNDIDSIYEDIPSRVLKKSTRNQLTSL